MRHQKTGRRLSRTSSHRKAMWSNMVTSLIIHGRIETTEPKAKELKRIADRTISWAIPVADVATRKHKDLDQKDRIRLVNAKRQAARVIRGDEALARLFHEVAPLLARTHKGGYTRLLKTRFRTGDAAPMAFVELVEQPGAEAAEAAPAAAEPAAKKPRGKKEAAPAAAEATAEPAAKPKKSRKKAEAPAE